MPKLDAVPPLTRKEVRNAHDSAQRVVEIHQALSKWLRHGVTLKQVDQFVAKKLDDMGAKSCFFGYRSGDLPPYSAHACLSVNECVVHGLPEDYPEPLKAGDVLKVDVGVLRKGWIGDAAWTYVFGEKTDEVQRLTDCGKACIRLGIDELRAGNKLIEWARVVHTYVENKCGFHLIRGLGGHGYGKKLHTSPFISNTVPAVKSEWPDCDHVIEPGLMVAVEPMIAIGSGRVIPRGNGWPLCVDDGSTSVHYEHDILVTEDGPLVLTDGLDETPDLITR